MRLVCLFILKQAPGWSRPQAVECDSDSDEDNEKAPKYPTKRRAARRLGDLPGVPIDLLGLYVKYMCHDFKLATNPDGIVYGQVTARKCKMRNGEQYVEVALENERQRFELKASEVRGHVIDPFE